jgi:hypothetical protein
MMILSVLFMVLFQVLFVLAERAKHPGLVPVLTSRSKSETSVRLGT